MSKHLSILPCMGHLLVLAIDVQSHAWRRASLILVAPSTCNLRPIKAAFLLLVRLELEGLLTPYGHYPHAIRPCRNLLCPRSRYINPYLLHV